MTKNKNKLIYVNAKFLCEKPTGIGRFAIELSKILKNLNSEIVFVSPVNIVNQEIAKELEVITIGNLKGALWEQIELPLFLRKKNNPILINFTSTAPLFYKNQINTIHDISSIKHPEWYSRKTALYYKIILPYVSKNCKKIITVSNYVKKDLIEIYKVEPYKIDVIYNAVSEIFYRKSNFTPQIKKYILCVGSIDPRKNLQTVVNAFNIIKNNDISLVLIGHKHKAFAKHSIKITSEIADKVFFTGYIKDEELAGYYQNAEAFIFSSFEEGFGIPPIEAMASGCVTLVSNASCMPEICEDAAIYFNPHSEKELATKLETILSNDSDLDEMKLKSQNFTKKYSWTKSGQELYNIILKLTN